MSEAFKKQFHENYGPSYSRIRPDYSRCAEMVPGRGRGVGFYQCQRKNGHGPEGAWCKQHDPEAKKKRAAEQRAKWGAELEESAARRKQLADDKRLRPIYEAALVKIANGSNDPRKDAVEALAQKEKDK